MSSRISHWFLVLQFGLPFLVAQSAHAQIQPLDPSQSRTSLANRNIQYRVAENHLAVLRTGGVRGVIVDNAAIDNKELVGHRSGYNGIAKLTHDKQNRNIFVPGIAGLNFEHIHDGTTKGLQEKFEPRKFPMELRVVSSNTVELYQPPTGNWKLESCGRYEILADGCIQYTFECIPRQTSYARDFLGLFWASYIHQPQDKSIRFRGRASNSETVRWIKGITPRHGVNSTHRPPGVKKLPDIDVDFPLTLVNHPSRFEATESWYYGVCRSMALVQIFRPQDQIWIAQSPSGGGNGNPAWDFQCFIPNPKKGKLYRMVMRMAYVENSSPADLSKLVRRHQMELEKTQ